MEYMVRPENTARLTVTSKPIMFRYKDLIDDRGFLSVWVWVCVRICIEVQENLHFGMSQGFAGDEALHLGLVDGVD